MEQRGEQQPPKTKQNKTKQNTLHPPHPYLVNVRPACGVLAQQQHGEVAQLLAVVAGEGRGLLSHDDVHEAVECGGVERHPLGLQLVPAWVLLMCFSFLFLCFMGFFLFVVFVRFRVRLVCECLLLVVRMWVASYMMTPRAHMSFLLL